MRLRYLFILTFSFIALIPMILFWIWPYSKALESELNDVKERHLVIAKNLAGSFERYYQDVTGIFKIIDIDFNKNENNKDFHGLLKSYGFYSVMLISKTGAIKSCLYATEECPTLITDNILELAKNTIKKEHNKISTVTEDININSGPILLLVNQTKDNDIILGYLSTKYIIKMGKKVSFGEKGHAAVVDQEGNILAHPFDSWIKKRINISKVSAVQKMIDGKTGVEKFYSPALKGDMIAGYTSVPGANWGVMVPQPLAELEEKAKKIDNTAVLVMLLGLGLAFLITIPISFILIKPLEKLSKVISAIKEGDKDVDLDWNLSKNIPLEIRELNSTFINMMNNIQENKKAISHLAYIDFHTGLPNRNYFYGLTNKALSDMKKSGEKGALVFIDFDGFKLVNDTYGHRIGDDLLSLFGQRVIDYFSFSNENSFSFDLNSLAKIIPARLGGDEFVIFFRDIQDETEIKLKVEKLFIEVFSIYDLYGDVQIKLTGSAGVALFPEHADSYSKLLKLADFAMYDAKAAGKNTICFSKGE